MVPTSQFTIWRIRALRAGKRSECVAKFSRRGEVRRQMESGGGAYLRFTIYKTADGFKQLRHLFSISESVLHLFQGSVKAASLRASAHSLTRAGPL